MRRTGMTDRDIAEALQWAMDVAEAADRSLLTRNEGRFAAFLLSRCPEKKLFLKNIPAWREPDNVLMLCIALNSAQPILLGIGMRATTADALYEWGTQNLDRAKRHVRKALTNPTPSESEDESSEFAQKLDEVMDTGRDTSE
jgi:hypothetical protein